MNDTKHTPTPLPWHTVGPFCIAGGNPEFVIGVLDAQEAHDTNRANATHIVICVNAHDALTARVAELEAALGFLLDEADGLEGTVGTFDRNWLQVARDQGRAALKGAA